MFVSTLMVVTTFAACEDLVCAYLPRRVTSSNHSRSRLSSVQNSNDAIIAT